ncbi:hypothetical protein QBD00_002946 [Ochrobactrum sp. AN78]|nr:hypothetical protein [Ochrobactrum sp. AN78]
MEPSPPPEPLPPRPTLTEPAPTPAAETPALTLKPPLPPPPPIDCATKPDEAKPSVRIVPFEVAVTEPPLPPPAPEPPSPTLTVPALLHRGCFSLAMAERQGRLSVMSPTTALWHLTGLVLLSSTA